MIGQPLRITDSGNPEGKRNMNRESLRAAMAEVSAIMTANRDYLIQLDQQNGDGDLGISMSDGYKAAAAYLASAEETDLGRLLMKASSVFNEAAPSSLGTITAFGFMGMAKALKGHEIVTLSELAAAFQAGIDEIMKKAGSKPGEKTILDAICPAVEALRNHSGEPADQAFAAASAAAASGSESTRAMRSVHGRAAYYGDKSIGLIDGGSVVGALLFKALADYAARA